MPYLAGRFFGSWDALAEQVTTGGAWQRWQLWEADLARVDDLRGLRLAVRDQTQLGLGETLLGALLRIASTNGRDDVLAARAVAHLLTPGAAMMAGWLASRGVSDAEAMVAAQVWVSVRTAPVQRWQRRFAANLVWAIRKALAADALACGARSTDALFHAVDIDVVPELPIGVEPDGAMVAADPDVFAPRRASPTQEVEDELARLLAWGRDQGLITDEDATLVWEVTAASTDPGGTSRRRVGWAEEHVGHQYGLTARSVRRRRQRLVQVLAAHHHEYLAATA